MLKSTLRQGAQEDFQMKIYTNNTSKSVKVNPGAKYHVTQKRKTNQSSIVSNPLQLYNKET